MTECESDARRASRLRFLEGAIYAYRRVLYCAREDLPSSVLAAIYGDLADAEAEVMALKK